jgi:hypothetical protein
MYLFSLSVLLITIALIVLYPSSVHSWPVPLETSSVRNGLYTPTNSQRFFEQGRVNFEREIKRFQEDKNTTSNLLTIDEEIISQKQILSQQQWLLDLIQEQNNLPRPEKE